MQALNHQNKTIAIFASGTGSNALKIIESFKQGEHVNFVILSNKKDALVVESATKLNIPVLVFNREEFYKTNKVIHFLKEHTCNLIVLAGFLWLVPVNLVQAFPKKIINIHPALLPKYSGKGMYGINVHRAVVEAKEEISGMTIHYVNEMYDDGAIILQKSCKLDTYDSPEMVAQKVLKLEHKYYPKVVKKLIHK